MLGIVIMARRKGSALIDLLVVIAAVAILVHLLVPALENLRFTMFREPCASPFNQPVPLPACHPGGELRQAEAILRMALDAWQAGDDQEALQQRQPPIWFNEPECASVTRLLEYQVAEKAETHRHQARFVVNLTLQTTSGDSIGRSVTYLVDFAPNCVVSREGS
jgi:hypothetical protein